MEYNSAIQSVENITKAVMRLPRFMRSKFYQDFQDSTYDNNDLNLEYFEKWLANRLTEMFNPIAAIIETRESRKQNHSDKNKDNIKLKLLKIKKLCFNCLLNTHLINKCKSKTSCKIDCCKKRHHTILHPPNPPATNPPATNITTDTEVHNQNVMYQYRTNRAYLQIVPVKLMNKDIVVETNALLDTGSDTTLFRSDIATKLQRRR